MRTLVIAGSVHGAGESARSNTVPRSASRDMAGASADPPYGGRTSARHASTTSRRTFGRDSVVMLPRSSGGRVSLVASSRRGPSSGGPPASGRDRDVVTPRTHRGHAANPPAVPSRFPCSIGTYADRVRPPRSGHFPEAGESWLTGREWSRGSCDVRCRGTRDARRSSRVQLRCAVPRRGRRAAASAPPCPSAERGLPFKPLVCTGKRHRRSGSLSGEAGYVEEGR